MIKNNYTCGLLIAQQTISNFILDKIKNANIILSKYIDKRIDKTFYIKLDINNYLITYEIISIENKVTHIKFYPNTDKEIIVEYSKDKLLEYIDSVIIFNLQSDDYIIPANPDFRIRCINSVLRQVLLTRIIDSWKMICNNVDKRIIFENNETIIRAKFNGVVIRCKIIPTKCAIDNVKVDVIIPREKRLYISKEIPFFHRDYFEHQLNSILSANLDS